VRKRRSLRHENAKFKQLVADLTLDRHILQEIVRKKSCKPQFKNEKSAPFRRILLSGRAH
jgi:hypothetical protein